MVDNSSKKQTGNNKSKEAESKTRKDLEEKSRAESSATRTPTSQRDDAQPDAAQAASSAAEPPPRPQAKPAPPRVGATEVPGQPAREVRQFVNKDMTPEQKAKIRLMACCVCDKVEGERIKNLCQECGDVYHRVEVDEERQE